MDATGYSYLVHIDYIPEYSKTDTRDNAFIYILELIKLKETNAVGTYPYNHRKNKLVWKKHKWDLSWSEASPETASK